MDHESTAKKRLKLIVEHLRRSPSSFGWLAELEPLSRPSTLEQNNAGVDVTSSVGAGLSTERCSLATPEPLEVPRFNSNTTTNLVSHRDGATIRPVGRDDAAEPVEHLRSSTTVECLPLWTKSTQTRTTHWGQLPGGHPEPSCPPRGLISAWVPHLIGYMPRLNEVDTACNCLSLPPNTLVPSQQAAATVSSVALSDLPPSLTPPPTTSSSSNDPCWSSLKRKFPKGDPGLQ